MATTTETSTTTAKPLLNKKQLVKDFFAFFAVVGAYLFISLTYNIPIFEDLVGLKLNSSSDIIILFLYYTLLILVVKAAVTAIAFLNKAKGLHPIATAMSNSIDSSLFAVLIIAALYFQSTLWKEDDELTISQLCHVSVWLFFAQMSRIFGSAFISFDIISIFGRTIQIILIFISLGEMMGHDLFLWI